MIQYIDLFAGIGGIRQGITSALTEVNIESQCVLSSEIDARACETYELNYHEHPSGDIHDISEIPPFDLLLAGFPCQPFSYAGKRLGFGDTRGTLFFEVERILTNYKPKAFLLENVRGLKTHDNGRTFNTIITKLHELGYGTSDILLNSSEFGVPQNRVRIYILGLLGATPKLSLTSNLGAADSHSYKSRQKSLFDVLNNPTFSFVKDVLEKNVNEKYFCSHEFEEQLKNVIETIYQN